MLYKIHQRWFVITIALTTSGILIASAQARNAFFPQGLGSQFTLGGAGTALPIEPTNVESNPAILTRIDNQIAAYIANYFQKQSLDTSSAFIAPGIRSGNVIGRQNNRLTSAPGGTIGVNYILNHKWAIGFGTSGGSAMVKYNAPTINPQFLQPPIATYNNQYVSSVMLLNPTVSYAHSPCDSYGFSLILGYQTVKTNLAVSGPLPPFPQTAGALRKDSATGVGARIGGLWDLNKHLSVGASASTPVKFTKFKKYKDIFRHSFDIPAIIRGGLAFHAANTDYLFDIKQIYFANVKSLSDDLGWKNSTILMVGVQHKIGTCLYLSGGYNYGKSPVGTSNVMLNGLIVPIARHHFTLGARYRLFQKWELSIGAEYSPTEQRRDDGTGKLGSTGNGAILRSREIGGILGIAYHY